ncbi:MAG: hypothetical protein ACTSWY_14715 [Promethearchaeota archaeon]
MPIEIFNDKEFLEISKKADHCRVKRSGNVVMLKLRTKKYLYILKTNPQKADLLTSKINIEILEL